MGLVPARNAQSVVLAAMGILVISACSNTQPEHQLQSPSWGGLMPRQHTTEPEPGVITHQKGVEPEEATRLDQLSDAETIQKNVSVERVDGEDPCISDAEAGVSCGREFQGRSVGVQPDVLPEVSLQMVRPQASQAFDPARAVNDIGRAEERDAQSMLAVGDRFLNPDEPSTDLDHAQDDMPLHDIPPSGIVIGPSSQ